ncbi:hypothetical protein ACLB1T_07545 [Escherichia coli]
MAVPVVEMSDPHRAERTARFDLMDVTRALSPPAKKPVEEVDWKLFHFILVTSPAGRKAFYRMPMGAALTGLGSV